MKHFKVKEIKPNIFLFAFKDYYEMGMHFLRYQEYYESQNPKFRGKAFTIFDFMKYHSKKNKDCFNYCAMWGGFNIPSSVIREVRKLKIPDPNKYDAEMFRGYVKCLTKTKGKDFYIIGAIEDTLTMKHEVSHGFFYTTPEFKQEMTALVKALDPNIRKSFNAVLFKMGYTPKVFVDEIQAYMATGLCKEMSQFKSLRKPFIKVFKKYYNK